tara:strand:+ start:61 stop:516 length:456 start_codon:yes stop_codon:yes gene_type:complete
MKRLILNRIKTPDGTILTSYHRHDYKSYFDKNGHYYYVDGGLDYHRCSSHNTKRNWFERKVLEPLLGYSDPLQHDNLCVYSDAPFEIIRKSLHWGRNMDKDKNILPKTIYSRICDLGTEHIKAIVENKCGSNWFRRFLRKELKYRNGFSVK